MRLIADPPFYPGEVVSGTVIRLYQHFALLNVRGYKIPLETRLMSWNEHRDASSILEIGQRIEVMALTRDYHTRQKGRSRPYYMSGGYWLSCLPLLENPWPALAERYPDGSTAEVELVDFDRKNDAIVQFPEGARTLAAMCGFYRHAKNMKRLAIMPVIGEKLKVIVRGKLDGEYWLQPYFGLSLKALPEDRIEFKPAQVSSGNLVECFFPGRGW